MSFASKIAIERQSKDILLMTHIVLGYPSLQENKKVIKAMCNAGVEFIELQIPYSEPSADGPVIVQANQESLKSGTKVSECFEFAAEVSKLYPKTSFLFMTYYNILFKRGEREFIKQASEVGIQGLIIPDLPVEESEPVMAACAEFGLENIFIYTPTNHDARLDLIAAKAQGFIYAVGRRGITGQKTDFDQGLADCIVRYKKHTSLALALGFGVKTKEDIHFLKGQADIAVIGTKLIELHQDQGASGVYDFLISIR
ncbi:MAG: tryptophan synthase subunit alpha [SAR324 cluster bacterium]|nr:tryptophan synthase subunit alpha [SAR324 cluster bacterium]